MSEGKSLKLKEMINVDFAGEGQPFFDQSLGQEITKLALQLFNFSRSMG